MNCLRPQEKDWHYEWLKKTVERLEEKRNAADPITEIHAGELQRVLLELLSMHLRCDRLEETLANLAFYSFPPNPRATIEMPWKGPDETTPNT
jgi:hypothetical protein